MSTLQGSKELHALRFAVAVYVSIFILKLMAYFTTCVMVLLAEALHTFSDIFISDFLLVTAIYSRKEADKIEEAGRIAEEIRKHIHSPVSSRYCIIHVYAAGGYYDKNKKDL